ncbi:hypothetical protein MXB_2996 [Myxobolus squamalis]|nr:hypothetical protein MXB_2996 [Myxobolus squamalis]
MYRYSTTPLNAIQQSSEFVDLGKQESALEILFDAIRVRRGKTWSPSIEEAMINYLNLCLNLRNTSSFKDGMNQYRMLCQLANVSSFDKVVNKFFKTCLDASDRAKNQSREKNLITDLDELETPETIILKSISETTQQDRTDRILLSPILKFTWEAFRNILEVCRNNRNMEKIYAEMAKKSFKFLLQFERKTEFRKLCDVTRIHLQQIVKYNQNTLSINLGDPASIDLQLEVRLGQLDSAISMELWNEAFKTMEDIHFLLRLTKKAPHPKILAIFYQKISLVFSKANVPLFHAIALQKLFVLIKEHKKGFKPEEMTKVSSRVLAATISVPLTSSQTEIDVLLLKFNENWSNPLQLAAILGLGSIPTRNAIVEEMIKISILQYADPIIVNIFNAIHGYAHYKNLCQYVDDELANIPAFLIDDMSPYLDSIRKVAFCTLLKKLGEFYKSVSLSRIAQYANYYTQEQVLSMLLECHHSTILHFQYDGESGFVHFSGNPSAMSGQSQFVRPNFISNLTNQIVHAHDDLVKKTRMDAVKNMIEMYRQGSPDEYYRYQRIREDVIKYMDNLSAENDQMDKKMVAMMEEERVRIELAQMHRMDEERHQREEKRQQQDLKEKRILNTLEQVGDISGNSEMAKKMLKDIDVADFEKNPTKYITVHNELRDKEIMTHVKKMKKIEKKFDVFVHVLKITEIDKIRCFVSNSLPSRKINFQNRDQDRISSISRLRKNEDEIKSRLVAATDDINDFMESCEQKAIHSHQQLIEQYEEMLVKERALVLAKKRCEYIQKSKFSYKSPRFI